jgi:hypothetical protein
MEMLDRYLQALKTYLPKEQQKDILAELSDTIQSEVEEQEAALGRRLNRAEEEAVLKRFGHPLVAAGRYRPQQYLIGPIIYPYYLIALKVMASIMVLVHVIVAVVIGFRSEAPLKEGLETLGGLVSALVFAVGFVTLGFAVLERNQVRFHFLDRWDPSTLPRVKKSETHRIPLSESIGGLVLGTVVLLFWLGVPPLDRIVFGGDGVAVRLAPDMQRYYTPVLVVLLLGLAQNAITLARPYWTVLHAIGRVVSNGLIVVILYAVTRIRSFVVIVDSAGNTGTYADKAQLLNQVILVGLGITAGICLVDGLLNLWRLVRGLQSDRLTVGG